MAKSIDFRCTCLDELDALDKGNIISSSRRTRGKRVNYTEASDIAGLGNDNASKSEGETQKVKKGASAEPRTRSPQRKPVTDIGEEEGEEEEEYGSEEEYEGDDGGDEDNEDDITDEDEEEE